MVKKSCYSIMRTRVQSPVPQSSLPGPPSPFPCDSMDVAALAPGVQHLGSAAIFHSLPPKQGSILSNFAAQSQAPVLAAE